MAVTLLATQVPIPAKMSSIPWMTDAYITSPRPTLNIAKALQSGDTVFSDKFNRNACELDNLGATGAGVIGVYSGLTLATSLTLTLTVAAGRAIIGGPVEAKAALTTNVTPSISRIHVWLRDDATLITVNNSTTPPAGNVCYLGSCVSSGTAITSVDDSGRWQIRSNMLYRETADSLAPADSPASDMVFLTKTTGGLYLWDGNAYRKLVSDNVRQIRSSIGAGLTLSAGATNYIPIESATALIATEADAEFKLSYAVTFRKLKVRVSTVGVATGTCSIVVRKNGVDTALKVDLTSGSSTGWNEDNTNAITFASGDTVSIKVVGATSGSPVVTAIAMEELL